MGVGKPHSDDAVDRLVGEYVQQAIDRADAGRLISRIRATRHRAPSDDRARVATSPVRSQRARWSRGAAWAAMTAVAATIAFVGGRYVGPRTANAAVVLRDVQSVHARPIDHCYRVQFAPDPRSWDGRNMLEGPSSSVLWTRGDRFWADCTIGDLHLKLGRQDDGTLWVSSSPSHGFRFTNDPSHLPPTVSLLCAINSMSVPQLTRDVLADFDVHSGPAAEESIDETVVIWAKLKADRSHPLLSDALLEIDPRTNVLSRLVLWTVRDGRPRGTVTYTLLESTTRGDDRYELQSHLDDGATIESQTFPMPDDPSPLLPAAAG